MYIKLPNNTKGYLLSVIDDTVVNNFDIVIKCYMDNKATIEDSKVKYRRGLH